MRIALILARGGSKSIPFKNIINVGGKPLIFYMIDALINSQMIDEIHVSTDCPKISKTIRNSYREIIIFSRSNKHATDCSSSENAIIEFIDCNDFDSKTTFIFAQSTSPLTTCNDVIGAINSFEGSDFDSVLSVVRQKRFIWSKDGKPLNYDFYKRPRRQEFDGFFVENGALYISTVGQILEYKSRISGKIGIFEMADETYFELDEVSDLKIIENILSKKSY